MKDIQFNESSIIKADCMDILQYIPSKSIDFICCDLPYGVTSNKKDISLPLDTIWEQYNRIIKDNGTIALFAQGLFYVDLVNSNRKNFRYDIVWDKILLTGHLNAKRMPMRCHEQIAIFYKKTNKYYPQFKEGKPLHSKGTSYINKEMTNNNYGKNHPTDDSRAGITQKYPKSIITIQKPHPSKALHRTEKPVELLSELILTYTDKNDIILDNTAGSGSLGVAAIQEDRRFILIEKDDIEYLKMKERILTINDKIKYYE